MEKSGIIKEIKNDKAIVMIFKESSCAHCNKCSENEKISNELEIPLQPNMNIGDTITFEMNDKKLYKIATLIYILPLIAMIIGYFVGQLLNFSEKLDILLSFIFLILTFLIIHFYDKIYLSKDIIDSIKIISIEKK